MPNDCVTARGNAANAGRIQSAGIDYAAGSRPARAVERLMASKTNATPQKEEVPKKEGPETSPDSPLLDLSDAAVKKLIRSAKKRGYVTHDQINALLSSEEVKSEQIEDILAMFSGMGVNVVETEEAEPEDEGARVEPDDDCLLYTSDAADDLTRVDLGGRRL